MALTGFEPATFVSSGKHTNHYTTKVTRATDDEYHNKHKVFL
jgi:hypothetical protein